MDLKKERVVVACVVFEVSKVVKPIIEYEATRVHLIHYADKERGKIYKEFYDEVCGQIVEYSNIRKQYEERSGKRSGKEIEVIEHADHKTSDFQKMLMTVLYILRNEKAMNKDSEIYVNISSGTAEFTAAAMMAAMMVDGVRPFRVGTEKYTANDEELLRSLYIPDGKPLGLTEIAGAPRELPSYKIMCPDERLVRGLKKFRDIGATVSTAAFVDILAKDEDVWIDRAYEKTGANRTDKKQSDLMKYRRNFLSRWEENGWVVQREYSKRYKITEEGQWVIDTFCADGIDKKTKTCSDRTVRER